MLFHPRDQLTLRQRFRRCLSRFVVQVTEAQARPSVVMCQPGSRYWWLLQITTQVACRIPPAGRLLGLRLGNGKYCTLRLFFNQV